MYYINYTTILSNQNENNVKKKMPLSILKYINYLIKIYAADSCSYFKLSVFIPV